MKFEIEGKERLARYGWITLRDRRYSTPMLFTSYSFVNSNPLVWKEIHDLDAILLNGYEIYQILKGKYRSGYHLDMVEQLLSKGDVHKSLGFENPVMMDSGGYQVLTKQIEISPSDIMQVQLKADPDIAVFLDYPLKKTASYEAKLKTVDKTLQTLKQQMLLLQSMSKNQRTPIFLPVLHAHSPEMVDYYVGEVRKIAKDLDVSIQELGVGSVVPLLFPYGTEDYKTAVEIMIRIREKFPNIFIHVFGVGSSQTILVFYYLGADSIDSSAWIHKARYGKIHLPGQGEMFIDKRRSPKAWAKEILREAYSCECPVCKTYDLRNLAEANRQAFKLRSLHNAYVYQNEVRLARIALKNNEFESFVLQRLTGKSMEKMITYTRRRLSELRIDNFVV